MKKLILSTFILCTMFSSVLAGGNEIASNSTPLDNGLSLKAHIGITGSEYGVSSNEIASLKILDALNGTSLEEDLIPKVSFGVELGSQWYFYKNGNENLGIGLFINWFDFNIAAAKYETFGTEITNVVANMSALEFGPIATLAVSDNIGLDAYYQLCPTVITRAIASDNFDESSGAGFGFTHAFGAAFRYRLLYAGLEYNTGKIKVEDTDDENYKEKVSTDNLRLIFGFKF